MRKILHFAIILLASGLAFAQGGTTSSDLYPAVTGQNLGNPSQRWNLYAQNIDCDGTGCPNICADQFSSLAAAIAATPAGGELCLNPGTYSLSALTITQSIRIVGRGYHAAQVQITGSPNVAITVNASNVTFDNLDLSGASGQLFSVVGQTGFVLNNSYVHGVATFKPNGTTAAGVYLQGGAHHKITNNTFSGNGPNPVVASSSDIVFNYNQNSSNYFTDDVLIEGNTFSGGNTSFQANCFNCKNSWIVGNNIDANNAFQAAGQAYPIEFYNTNFTQSASWASSSGTVTLPLNGTPFIAYTAGVDYVMLSQQPTGAAGVKINGPCAVVSGTSGTTLKCIPVGPAVPDDNATGVGATNFYFANNHADHNTVSNAAGNCIYYQSTSGEITGNILSKCALQQSDTSLPIAGISLTATYMTTVGENVILDSGNDGFAVAASRQTSFVGNTISNPAQFGIDPRITDGLNSKGNKIFAAGKNGIGSKVSSAASCTNCTFDDDMTVAPGTDAISFPGPETSIDFAGGHIYPPLSGTLQHAVLFTNASSSGIKIHDMEMFGTPVGAASPTIGQGIKISGSGFDIYHNTITGFSNTGTGVGIQDLGTGNRIHDNISTGNYDGAITTGATNPHVWNNDFSGSTITGISFTAGQDVYNNLLSASGIFPALALNTMVTDAYAATLNLDFTKGLIHTVTLTGDTSLNVSAFPSKDTPNPIAVLGICQDGSGGHAVNWGPHFPGHTTVSSTASACTWQVFGYDGSTTFNALGQGQGGSGSFTTLTLTASGTTVTTAGTAVTNGTCQAQTPLTVTGVTTASVVAWSIPTALPATWQTGITVVPVVTANTVTLNLCNPTAGSITPAAQAVNIRVIQ